MLAQTKTQNGRGFRRRSPIIHIRSAYRRVASRFSLTIQSVKNQLLKCIQRHGRLEDTRQEESYHEEPYFWVESYNRALLEADTKQIPGRVQSALREVEQRRGVLERGRMDGAEWNLLQYAEIVLSQMTGGALLTWRPRKPRASNPIEEKNAA